MSPDIIERWKASA